MVNILRNGKVIKIYKHLYIICFVAFFYIFYTTLPYGKYIT